MKTIQIEKRGGDVWSPIVAKNSVVEWLLAILFAAGSTWFMMAYHDWWRRKPYSLMTLNESLALAAYYALALAFVPGPLYRFGAIPSRWVAVRRPLGIAGVICAILHVLITLIPLRNKYGWNYLVLQHGDLTALGALSISLALWLLKTSLGSAVQRLGVVRWFRIQWTGVALVPLVLAHFMVLGKIADWLKWFGGHDPKPAPPGTFVAFALGAVIILLRVVDLISHVRIVPSTDGSTKGDKP